MVLTGSQAHHLKAVLRMEPGASVELFDGVGKLAQAEIRHITRQEVTLQVVSIQQYTPREKGRIVIVSSVAKGERFDWMIGKCTELGAHAIWPVVFQRTVKLATGQKVQQRWEKLAIEAAKQCRRLWLPEIAPVAPIAECVDRLGRYVNPTVLYGSLGEDAQGILDVAHLQRDVIAFVGPEGGIAADEEEMLRQAGAQAVRLGDTILRTETAAVAMVAVLAALSWEKTD